jgi:predicted GIY-YIG superfamily endonuclease
LLAQDDPPSPATPTRRWIAASPSAPYKDEFAIAEPPIVSFASQMREPTVYIMASKLRGTLYTGVTSNLPRRAHEHRKGLTPGFTKQYGCKILVWYEPQATMPDAITREKQIKAGSRADKIRLIEAMNPDWRDLYPDFA